MQHVQLDLQEAMAAEVFFALKYRPGTNGEGTGYLMFVHVGGFMFMWITYVLQVEVEQQGWLQSLSLVLVGCPGHALGCTC